MMKFFDISLDWLDPNLRAMHKRDSHTEEHFALRECILGPIEEAFKNGMEVQVIKTNKANGEMCQISWSDFLKSWCVCSKNVGMAVRTKEDLK